MKKMNYTDRIILALLLQRANFARVTERGQNHGSALIFRFMGATFSCMHGKIRVAHINGLQINPQHLVFALMFRIFEAFERNHEMLFPAISRADYTFE